MYLKKKLKQKVIFSDLDQDPDPYQNETDPQHCVYNMGYLICMPHVNWRSMCFAV